MILHPAPSRCLQSVFDHRQTERGLLQRAARKSESTNSAIHVLHLLFLLPLILWLIERPRSHRRLIRSNCRTRRTATLVVSISLQQAISSFGRTTVTWAQVSDSCHCLRMVTLKAGMQVDERSY
jgi:hypothetical protein